MTGGQLVAATEMIGGRTGLALSGKGARAVLSNRLTIALERHGGPRSVMTDPRAYQDVVNDLVVGETYLFREPAHFRWLIDEVLPDLLPTLPESATPTLVSAGCSTGEEAFSLAATAMAANRYRFRVAGIDLSERAIRHARLGSYGKSSVRGELLVHPGAVFVREGSQLVVRERVRARVHFSVGNLLSARDTAALPRAHVVLCRHVLMYLTPEARDVVIDNLARRLMPGGWLVVSATDPTPAPTALLEPLRQPWGTAYRRTGAATIPARSPE